MYKTIYTTTGLALVSKAVSQQRTIELTHFAVGDGVNTFNVPDARGEFPRYADAGRVVGSKQSQQVLKHKHHSFGENYVNTMWHFGRSTKNGYLGTNGGLDWDNYLYYTSDGTEFDGDNPNPAGAVGNENRPRNIALLACIRS